jgi:hypothetical protein
MKKFVYYFYLINLLIFQIYSISFSQVIKVQGKIFAGTTPVRNCELTFINENDTAQRFSTITDTGGYYRLDILTKVENVKKREPDDHNLMQNYPNPFNENTMITYKMPSPEYVNIKIYNILGQMVKNIEKSSESSGFHQYIWDGRDNFGKKVSYGIYFYTIKTSSWSESRKMLFLSGKDMLQSVSIMKKSDNSYEGSSGKQQYLEKGFYTIRIKNIEQTEPLLVEMDLKNIQIKSDTTLDYFLEKKREFLGQISSDLCDAVIKPDGILWTMGANWRGQLGTGKMEHSDTIPVRVKNIDYAVSMEFLEGIAVAADRKGNIWFWGDRWTIDDPSNTIIWEPIKISFLSGVKYLNIYARGVNLLRNDGTVWHIELDNGNKTKYIDPVPLTNLKNIKHISQSLALGFDGKLYQIDYTKPEGGGLIPGISDVVDFDNAWNRRTVLLKKDGMVWAWGKNQFGELGDGTLVNNISPVQVKNLSDIVDISIRYGSNVALKKDGTAWFWGFAGYDNDNINKPYIYSTPVRLENIENIVMIDAEVIAGYLMKSDTTYWGISPVHNFPHRLGF